MTIVRVVGKNTRVTVGPGAPTRVIVSRDVIAKIDANRPRTQLVKRDTPVRVEDKRPIQKISLGVRGAPGRDGAPGSTIPPIDFSWGDAPGVVWTPVSPGMLVYARIRILTPFNGAGASIMLGTAGDPDIAFPAAYNDPAAAEEFTTTPDVNLATGQGVVLTINPGAGASAGAGQLLLEFLPT